jgi:hypothetical protein
MERLFFWLMGLSGRKPYLVVFVDGQRVLTWASNAVDPIKVARRRIGDGEIHEIYPVLEP